MPGVEGNSFADRATGAGIHHRYGGACCYTTGRRVGACRRSVRNGDRLRGAVWGCPGSNPGRALAVSGDTAPLLTGELSGACPGLWESRASVFTTKGAEMESTPIFNGLRNEREFMCQACTDHGWPFAMFVCAGDGLCDDHPWPLFEAA